MYRSSFARDQSDWATFQSWLPIKISLISRVAFFEPMNCIHWSQTVHYMSHHLLARISFSLLHAVRPTMTNKWFQKLKHFYSTVFRNQVHPTGTFRRQWIWNYQQWYASHLFWDAFRWHQRVPQLMTRILIIDHIENIMNLFIERGSQTRLFKCTFTWSQEEYYKPFFVAPHPTLSDSSWHGPSFNSW